jgi:hypothetical protein
MKKVTSNTTLGPSMKKPHLIIECNVVFSPCLSHSAMKHTRSQMVQKYTQTKEE